MVGLRKGAACSLLVGLFVLVSCAAFPYKYYGIHVEDWRTGKLLGEKEKDDLPLTVCEPSETPDGIKGKCVVMLVEEYHRMRSKFIEMQERLKGCEESR